MGYCTAGWGLRPALWGTLIWSYRALARRARLDLSDWGLRLTVVLAVPSAAALAVLALPLVAALFHYGRFTSEDAWMTRDAVAAYSIGLIGMILVKILAPGFYARQNIATPVKIGIFTLVATQAMNLALPQEEIIRTIYYGLADPEKAPMPYIYPMANLDYYRYGYNLEAAKKLQPVIRY